MSSAHGVAVQVRLNASTRDSNVSPVSLTVSGDRDRDHNHNRDRDCDHDRNCDPDRYSQ
jgi:hypothetical protein